jgi:hypothetical protein
VFNRFFFKRTPRRLATIIMLCGACAAPAAQDLCRVRTHFGLFFVPLVPLPTTYRTTCATCGTSTTVSAEQADRLMASAPHVDDPLVTEPALAGSSAAA